MQHSDRNPRVSNPHQRHGYSLLELLITLAVVIWLGSLSIANLGKIKGQIHRMTCTSHLRQWGQATILFASDHDDWLPMDGAPNGRRSNGKNLFHYAANRHINGTGAGNRVKLSGIVSPNQTIWMFDNGGLAAVGGWNQVHTNLHSKGSNFLFLDASVDHRNNFDYWDFEDRKARVSPHGMQWLPSLGKPLP